MGSVSVRIGHDNDLVIVSIFKGKVCTNTCPNSVNHGIDFLILENVSHLSFGGIDNFSS